MVKDAKKKAEAAKAEAAAKARKSQANSGPTQPAAKPTARKSLMEADDASMGRRIAGAVGFDIPAGGKAQTPAQLRQVNRQLNQVFQEWDVDGSGCISKAELCQVIRILDPSVSTAQLEKMFSQADADKDGFIDYHEFCDWLMS
eukprot:gnl/TRDRNA2_/TRDRNA2_94009_c0_seq1.p2 gnl/TRDRNA2_/TRDRNA2_94009_c0~~gnl/TRDRNA2_/TRDRNA2_94009_c0_seq1.p2  ORF type:complete len:144 (-),score=38.54 gnl/TRDRNA2_/TRDRNA2_94009_c0_seq1:103-534(-)